MRYVNTKNKTIDRCGFFFGLEEYLIKNYEYKKDIFLLWKVRPTVMIGRHQITQVEIDDDYVTQNNIEIVRRNSGGGAVYTDPGCFQFSFITDKMGHQDIFKRHVSKIINAINKLGLNATFTGRNDILMDGRKFSGNAEYIYKDRMVIHGTILYNTNMDHLIGSLTPDKSKLTKHAISSVKSRVINIGSLIGMEIDDFYDYLVDEISTEQIDLATLNMEIIHNYENKFYQNAWNYGKNPKYEYHNKMKFESGNYSVSVSVKKNIVQDMNITGDFFSLTDIETLEDAFKGVAFTRDAFVEITKKHRIKDYFYGLKRTEFLILFFGEKDKKKPSKPSFLRINMEDLNRQTKDIRALLKQHDLHTVCQEASCPNQLECFSNRTATFMILGNRCTRNCAFCDVVQGTPQQIDKDEPQNLVRATKVMGLQHVVLTSVTRDDLRDDYGSTHFANCIAALQEEVPDTTIEVLIPDFQGHTDAIKRVVDAKPQVINHNIETVQRLYPGFRDRAKYDRSLKLLQTVKELDPTILTKSGIMVGIGESFEEVRQVMIDLREVGCDILTIGQYLQPSKDHAPVIEYISLEQFNSYQELGKELGFSFVASGPLVRSSYQAYKQFKGE